MVQGISRRAAAARFLGYGVGWGVVLSVVSLGVGFWIIGHLPVVTGDQKPWWLIF